MTTEPITDRARQLGHQLLEALKRPDDPVLRQAHEREEDATSDALDTFYAQTGQPSVQTGQASTPVLRAPAPALATLSEPRAAKVDHAVLATTIASACGLLAAGLAAGLILVPQIASGGLSVMGAVALIAAVGSFALHVRSYFLQRGIRRSLGETVREPPKP